MVRNFLSAVPKIIFTIFCYIMAIVIGCISAYFTFSFYTNGNKGMDFYALGFMAVSLELIKFVFATVYPFVKYRDIKTERTIRLILKVTFFLSILASLYYLLLGKDISLSPASKTMEMLYLNIPALNIIPLAFSQFLGTISLSILIEFLIIYLPTVAPVLFKQKDYNRKTYSISNLDKLKEIVKVIPERVIDNLYEKIVKDSSREKIILTELEPKKPELKLLKNDKEIPKLLNEKSTEKEDYKNSTLEIQKPEKLVNDKDVEEVLDTIFKHKNGFFCPSIAFLTETTSLTRTKIHQVKKYLDELGIITTNGKCTTVNVDTKEEALKAIECGGVFYEIEEGD